MAAQVTRKPPTLGNRMFDHGVLSGSSCFHQFDTPNVLPSAATIGMIFQILIGFARKGNLTEELLRQDVGILFDLCWITPRFLP
jgi:hypothetical protein